MYDDESLNDNFKRLEEVMRIMPLIKDEKLNKWELELVQNIRNRLVLYGDDAHISKKQLFKLRDLKDKSI